MPSVCVAKITKQSRNNASGFRCWDQNQNQQTKINDRASKRGTVTGEDKVDDNQHQRNSDLETTVEELPQVFDLQG